MPFHPEIRIALLFGFLAFVLWLISRKVKTSSELMKLHLEGRNRLLDRFGDAEDFLTFARSEEGRALLEAHSLVRGPQVQPGLRLFQCGLVALPVGVGLGKIGAEMTAQANLARGSYLDHRAWSEGGDYQLMGILLLTLGVGLLLAGLLAWFSDRTARTR